MPFTFSHPAIVLPFLKIRQAWVSMSGLVIGSMTPDFEYFIKMKLSGRVGHSLEGVFLFDLPVACVIALVFHQLVKRPLINNSPDWIRQRLIPLRDFDFLAYLRRHFVGLVCCVLIGSATHILWDSFTHPHEYFRGRISFLSTIVSIDGFFSIPLYNLLQHTSTLIGAGFIFWVFHRLPVQHQENSQSLRFWIISLAVAGVSFMWRASFTFEHFGDIVVSMIGVGIIGLIVSSIFSYWTSRSNSES